MPNLVDTWVKFINAPEALTEKPLEFETWIPIPEEIQNSDSNTLYKWKKENWGATWISEDYEGRTPTPVRLLKQDDGSYECKFITPWNPPLRFLWRLLELFPGLEIEYEYCDYMACYCGFGTSQEVNLLGGNATVSHKPHGGTGCLEEQNKFMEYESKEDLERIWAMRDWHIGICNPHLRDE